MAVEVYDSGGDEPRVFRYGSSCVSDASDDDPYGSDLDADLNTDDEFLTRREAGEVSDDGASSDSESDSELESASSDGEDDGTTTPAVRRPSRPRSPPHWCTDPRPLARCA